ncbi:MAG: VCBS repeat-containing protein [Acidobacteriales bacterium]|nr:VCBS repeat-containing protein [Terriglobales bacterium]
MNVRLLSAALLIVFTTVLGSAQQFIVAPTIHVGPASGDAVTADFDGDGNPDLALTNPALTILLGNGDGTFRTVQSFPGQSFRVSIGDWNSDGVLDLAVVKAFPDEVSVFLGLGDGTFSPPTNYPFTSRPQGIAAGDLNGDGIADLVTANHQGSVSVLLGQGGGTFASPVNYTLGNPFDSDDVVVGDFNRDGKLDAAAVQPDGIVGGSLDVLLGNGDGSLQQPTLYPTGNSYANHAVSADFNHDGIPDIATSGDDVLGVLLGNGDGTFRSAQIYAYPVVSGAMTLADLNGDGNVDIVAVNTGFYPPSGIVVFLSKQDGTFQDAQIFGASTGDPATIAIADFNKDGYLDAVVPNGSVTDKTSTFFAGRAGGTFVARRSFTLSGAGFLQNNRELAIYGMAVGYLDGDRNPDLVMADYFYAHLIVALGQPDGTFRGHRQFSAPAGVQSVAAADFNRDGKTDLVTNNEAGISVFPGRGDGTFPTRIDYKGSAGTIFVTTADMNADGKLDVVAVDSDLKSVSVYLNDGTGHFGAPVDTAMSNIPKNLAVGDFDGDGKLDIVTANLGAAHAATVLLGNGDGTFTVKQTVAAGTKEDQVLTVAVADVNLDGKLDLVVSGGVKLFVFLGNGDGTVGNGIQVQLGFEAKVLQFGDFNRDGKPDIASPGWLLVGNGDGTFSSQEISIVEGGDAQGIGDFNHDGALDIAVAGQSSPVFAVLINTGAK